MAKLRDTAVKDNLNIAGSVGTDLSGLGRV